MPFSLFPVLCSFNFLHDQIVPALNKKGNDKSYTTYKEPPCIVFLEEIDDENFNSGETDFSISSKSFAILKGEMYSFM